MYCALKIRIRSAYMKPRIEDSKSDLAHERREDSLRTQKNGSLAISSGLVSNGMKVSAEGRSKELGV